MKHHFRVLRVLRFSNWLLLGLHLCFGAYRNGGKNTGRDSSPEVQSNQQVPSHVLRFHCLWGVWTQLEEDQAQ